MPLGHRETLRGTHGIRFPVPPAHHIRHELVVSLGTKVRATIYTNGSVTGGTVAGGRAAMEPQNEIPLTLFLSTRQKCVGLRWAPSYEEEKVAFLLALDWGTANCLAERITMCPEDQSRSKASEVPHRPLRTFAND